MDLEPTVTVTVTIGVDSYLGPAVPSEFPWEKLKALNQPERTKQTGCFLHPGNSSGLAAAHAKGIGLGSVPWNCLAYDSGNSTAQMLVDVNGVGAGEKKNSTP